ncbi:MAG TPA: Holliday junction branch migration protein RuvA [Geminicoccaceae bacterium]|nr:Holliday junction branch migration protein RuvA [Geminicoccaceae bacterium]
MIARLRGRLDAVEDGHAVIDVGGVGYLVACSARTLANLPRPGEAVDLLIETQVRDDAITLYGFPSAAERRWFRLLQTVQGVGARVALGILAVLGPDELARAVAAQDKPALARANGVGPRLAGRIASELRERLGELPGIVGAPASPPITALGGPAADAVSALVNLGYGRSDAHAAIAKAAAALGEGAPLEALIRTGLQELARPSTPA